MSNITYLLGAGASCNAMPIYKNFSERFEIFTNLFKGGYQYNREANTRRGSELSALYTLLSDFLQEFDYHNTPDTIAKKLYHVGVSGSLDLKIVKQILILFFLYEQIIDPRQSHDFYTKEENGTMTNIKQLLDKRYDLLLAGLLKPIKGKFDLLNQFKVLTWNYDLQLELAYSKMSLQPVNISQSRLQSFPKIHITDTEEFDINKFAIVYLNGIAYGKVNEEYRKKDLLGTSMKFDSELVEYLLDVHKSMNIQPRQEGNMYEEILTFAWKNLKEDYSIKNNPTLNKAIQIAQQTEYLVIIGYSFPIFNSSIDTEIFKNMNRLQKIYIQSPDAGLIKKILANTYFKDRHPGLIEDVGYTSPFYIPNEWNFGSDVNNMPFFSINP